MPSANLTEAIDNLNIGLTSVGDVLSSAAILIVLLLIPLILTLAMFLTRQTMLGFPSAMFWFILGGYAYTQSTTPWGDWQFYLFFASSFGMTIFTAFAAYGLREKRDTIADEEMDETDKVVLAEEDTGNDDLFFDEVAKPAAPSKRVTRLHDRAKKRRERRKNKTDWGEFA